MRRKCDTLALDLVESLTNILIFILLNVIINFDIG